MAVSIRAAANIYLELTTYKACSLVWPCEDGAIFIFIFKTKETKASRPEVIAQRSHI